MKIKIIAVVLSTIFLMTGCVAQNNANSDIPQEEQERIFERFYRVDASRSVGEGTGLGLSIVKHGAALHNGKISVSSEIGQGTRMCVTFPLEQLDMAD